MSYTRGKLTQAGLDTKDPHWMREIRNENNSGIAFCGSFPAEQAHADARRLVACWNACEGISTEALEKENMLPAFDREQDRADKAERQRDDLLEALEAIINDGIHCDVVPHLHTKAMEAIKKARG